MLIGAVATVVAAILPSMPISNPALGSIRGTVVGVSAVISHATTPAATPIVVTQIVQAAQTGNATQLDTVISLALLAGASVVLKSVKKVCDTTLSDKATVDLLQCVALNTISMSLPLAFGAVGCTLIGWQNVSRIHNAIIIPMVVPGISLLLIAKVLGHGKWKEALLATAGGVLAIVAASYHPLAIGVVLSSIYGITAHTARNRPLLCNSSHATLPSTNKLYNWEISTVEMIKIPQWVYTCIQIGTTLIGVPVSQLYSIMKYGYECNMSPKSKEILEEVIGNIETMMSIVFYLLWGMAREGSFTDPMSKALQGVAIEWYIPCLGILIVIGTIWYLYYYLDITIPLYLNYKVEGIGMVISSVGMLFLGAHLLTMPLWLPVIGLGLGLISSKMKIDISMLGSMMPLIGMAGAR